MSNNKELGLGVGYVFNTEMLESLDVDYSNIMTEADLELILEAAHEKYPDVYPLVSYCGYMQDFMLPLDWLDRNTFGVLLDAFDDENTEVVNFGLDGKNGQGTGRSILCWCPGWFI